MRVVAQLTKFYNWDPVPDQIDGKKVDPPTPADIAADRVRPAANGGWRMRVTRPGPTELLVVATEADIIGKIFHEKCRPQGGRVLTRKQAIAFYVGENHLPGAAKREWITGFSVHDDGPDEALMRAMLVPHGVAEATRVKACNAAGTHALVKASVGSLARCVSCGHIPSLDEPAEEPNIPVTEHAAHLAAYLEKVSDKDLVDHLHIHFKVKAVKS